MKKIAVFALILAVAAMACSKSADGTKIAQGTPAYDLAKTLAATLPLFDPDKNAVLITAKDFNVTVGDVVEVIQGTMGAQASQLAQMDSERLKAAAAQTAVQIGERKLLLAAAAADKFAVPEDKIAAALTDQYTQAGGEEAFLEMLKTNNVDPAFVKKTVRDDTTIREYLETSCFAGIQVAEDDILKAYGEDKTASVRHILILTQNKTDAEKTEIRSRMEGILERARKGEDFAALAGEFTEDPGSKDSGGLYEDFGRGRMVPPFEEAAFTVPVGEISDIVETTYGFHILKIENRKKETEPLETVRAQLEEDLGQRKRSAAYEALLTELKAKAKFTEVKP